MISRASSFLVVLSSFLLLGLTYANSTSAAYTMNAGDGATRSAQARARLDAAKLKVCQTHEDAINKRGTQLIALVTQMETHFDAIALRVENYYTNTVVPTGNIVPNYESLVTAISDKKASVSTALTKAQNDWEGFSCNGEDPKGQLTQFRLDMQSTKSALKEYRTAIKNLIVAVHRKAPSPSPTASATPLGETN